MSTRCNIHFVDKYGEDANVYRHCDGYPSADGEGILPDLDQFFADVEAATSDTRFGDASYLAAKFVVWLAARYANGGNPLAEIGFGITAGDAADAAYIYRVECGNGERPAVKYRRAGDTRFRAAEKAEAAS